jgi:septum formation inhibitor-activating ATPase MinD
MMTRRRCPPPDLHYLEDGFILTEQEAKERLTTKMVINRRNKKIVNQPHELSEEEYVEQLKLQTRSILLEVCPQHNFVLYIAAEYHVDI